MGLLLCRAGCVGYEIGYGMSESGHGIIDIGYAMIEHYVLMFQDLCVFISGTQSVDYRLIRDGDKWS